MANKNRTLVKDEVATNEVVASENNVVDVDFSEIKKKKFRIDGDNDKILLLNTSDIGMITRLEDAEKRLVALEDELTVIKDLADAENSEDIAEKFAKVDKEMRDIVDYIFDANVSELCADGGSMYDPFNGKPRYEHIIDRLIPLYEENLSREAKALSAKAKKYTKKYTNK